jgi:hypothetical protein
MFYGISSSIFMIIEIQKAFADFPVSSHFINRKSFTSIQLFIIYDTAKLTMFSKYNILLRQWPRVQKIGAHKKRALSKRDLHLYVYCTQHTNIVYAGRMLKHWRYEITKFKATGVNLINDRKTTVWRHCHAWLKTGRGKVKSWKITFPFQMCYTNFK